MNVIALREISKVPFFDGKTYMLSSILEYQNKQTKIVKITPKIRIEYHVFLTLYVKKKKF